MGMIDSCAEVCAGLAPYEVATGCATNPSCEQDCTDSIAEFGCADEYWALAECAFQTPTSSWTCFPEGVGYVGNECSAELDALQVCIGI